MFHCHRFVRVIQRRVCSVWTLLLSGLLVPAVGLAGDPVVPAHRIYVPLEELEAVVERDAQRGVLLPRAEFEKLAAQARKQAQEAPSLPAGPAVPVCDYVAQLVGDQLLIHATAELRQFQAGWQQWTFPIQRLAVEHAHLESAETLVSRGAQGELLVLTPEAGTHRLELDLSTELIALGSDRVAAFSLLGGATGEFRLTLPAGKHLLVDGLLWERPAALDQPAEYRLPVGGRSQLQLRVTDRSTERASDALLLATTAQGLHVQPGEVTWQAFTTLQVFGRKLDRVLCSVPARLEITDVEASGLEAWELADDPQHRERTRLTLTFSQPFDGERRITFRGVMPESGTEPWSVPTLILAEATSHVGHLIVRHPAGIRLQVVEMEGVRRSTRFQPTGTDRLTDAPPIPARNALRFEVWREDFSLKLQTQPKQRELHTAVAAMLNASEAGVDLQAVLTLTTKFAPLFDLEFVVPAAWQVTGASSREGQPLVWELLPAEAGINQVRVKLAVPVPAEGSTTVKLQLRGEIHGWPVESEAVRFDIPEIWLPSSTLTETALVIRGDDDLELALEDVRGLDETPLQDPAERLRLQSQDTRYGARLKVTRKPARIAAEHVSFHRLEMQTAVSTLFSEVTVGGGGTRELVVSLPDSEGLHALASSVRFHAEGATLVEQQLLPIENGQWRWRLKFADRLGGAIVLSTSLELPRPAEPTVRVPLLAVAQAEREHGVLVVEAGPDQRLLLTAVDATGQPLREMDPLDIPAVPYVPSGRIVAVYRTVAAGATLSMTEERFEKAGVVTAVCPLLKLTTLVSRHGEMQQQAELSLLLAGVQQLRVELPSNATLWSVLLDGRPVEVRRTEGQFLIPIQGTGQGLTETQLALFYREQQPPVTGSGRWEQRMPTLSVLLGQGTVHRVEVLEQQWKLTHPEDTLVIEAGGPIEPLDAFDTPGWLARWRNWLRSPRLQEVVVVLLGVAVINGFLAVLVLAYRRFRTWGFWLVLGLMVSLGLLMMPFLMLGGRQIPVATKAVSTPSLTRSLEEPRFDAEFAAGHMPAPAGMPVRAGADGADAFSSEAGMHRALGITNGLALDERPQKQGSGVEGELQQQSAESPPPRAAAEKLLELESQAEKEQPKEERNVQALADLAREQPAKEPPPPAAAGQDPDREAPAVPGQAQRAANQPTSKGTAAAGLLSLAIPWEPPARSRQKNFRYVGTGARETITWEIQYLDRRRGEAIRCLSFVAGLFLGWCSRHLRLARKVAITLIGLGVTWGLLPLIPVPWQVFWDGLFSAIVGAVGLWSLNGCCRCCCRSAVCGGIGVALLLSCTTAWAEEKPAGPAAPSNTLVVPYDAARDPLAAERVWVPYEKFVELYRLAHPEQSVRTPAPQAGGIVEAWYAAELRAPQPGSDEGVVDVAARLMIRSYVEGQWQVSLPFQGVVVSAATLNGQPAALLAREAGLQVVIPQAGWHVLDVRFVLPARLTGPAGSFQFRTGPTPAARMTFLLPDPQLAVRINGSTSIYRRVTKDDRTSIEFPVDRGGEWQVNWQPDRLRGDDAVVLHVESVHALTVSDAGVLLSSGFQYRVRQGLLHDVSLRLPGSIRLQTVSGPDVGGWEILGEGPQRTLRIFLRRQVRDATQFTIDGYVDVGAPLDDKPFEVPEVVPREATVDMGYVAIYAAEEFLLRAEPTQLVQINADQFQPAVPVTRSDGAPQLLYRFHRRPWGLSLAVSRYTTQLLATVQQGVWITQRKVQTTCRVLCELARVPLSTIDLDVPADWLILDVQAVGLKDWYLTRGAARSVVTVEFNQARAGQVELVLLATAARGEQSSAFTLSSLAVRGAQKHQRTAALWLDVGWQGQVGSLGNWKSIDAGSLAPDFQQLRPEPPQFAFQSSAEDPGVVELKLTTAVPRLAANALTTISVTDVAVIYGFVWRWQIEAAATETLAVETPDWLAGRLDFTGENLREVTSAASEAGRIRWLVSLRGPVRGEYTLAATATLPPAVEQVAAPAVVFFPAQEREPLELQQHYVLLINTSLSQLTIQNADLIEPVQREDVPFVIRQELVAQATEFVRVRSLGQAPVWTMQRYASATTIPASVNLADLVTVLARDGTYRTQVTYTLKNRGRQFLAVQLPEGTQLLAVTVQSQPSRAVQTQLGGRPTHLIALPKTSAADLSFPVQVVYAGQLQEPLPSREQLLPRNLDIPAAQVVEDHDVFGIPVARTRWTLYLPPDLYAVPVSDPRRHNLNVRRSSSQDDTLVRVLLQDYEDLLNALDMSSSLKSRQLAEMNLEQLNQAMSGFGTVLQHDRQLAAERQRLQQRLEAKLSELSQQGLQQEALEMLGDESTERAKALQTTGDAAQQLNAAMFSNTAILRDNLSRGVAPGKSLEAAFRFALQQPISETAAAPQTAPSVEQAPSAAGQKLDARLQYQALNSTILEELNREVSEKRARFSQTQEQLDRSQDALGKDFKARAAQAAADSRAKNQMAVPEPDFSDPVTRGGANFFREGSMGRGGVPTPNGGWGGRADRPGMMGGGLGGGGGGLAVAQADLPALGRPAEGTRSGTQRGAAGLSLAFQLPQQGQMLVFSKAGGNPRLAVRVWPQRSWAWSLAATWTLACLIVVIVLLRSLRSASSLSRLGRVLPVLLAVAGILGLLVLSEPLNVFAGLVYLIAAAVVAWQHRRPHESLRS